MIKWMIKNKNKGKRLPVGVLSKNEIGARIKQKNILLCNLTEANMHMAKNVAERISIPINCAITNVEYIIVL